MTPDTSIKSLQRDGRAIFGRIQQVIANELGFGDIQSMSPDKQVMCLEDASVAYEAWTLAEVDDINLKPFTPLQHLLAELSENESRVLDAREAKWRA